MSATLDPWVLHTGGFHSAYGLEPVALHGAPVVALALIDIGDGLTVGVFVSHAAAEVISNLALGEIVDPHTVGHTVPLLNCPNTPVGSADVAQWVGAIIKAYSSPSSE